MPKANVDNVEIEYETIGDPTSKPLLLIAGLGGQLLAWSDEICESIAKRGFFVIRFDNRDVGLSTKFEDAGIPDFSEIAAAYSRGEKPNVPYTLEDMADDAVGVLDALNIEKAHILGASMGGMIAQVIAYRHSSRVLSLTIIMSTTGNPELPPGRPEIIKAFFEPVPSEREEYIEEMVKRDSLIYGNFEYDENKGREYRTREYDRSYYPSGILRQLAALSNIKPKISAIQAPTLVIHGSEDPFYPIEVANDIANAIPGAKLLIMDGMGHSFPNEVIPRIIDELVENSNRVSIMRKDMSQNDQIFEHFISVTSKHLEKSFSPAEAKVIHSAFTKRFTELYEQLKKKSNEKEMFIGINPIFVISLEESLPAKEKERKKVVAHVLAIYTMMLEDFVLEPQRRFMSSSKDPWSTFIEDTRKGNQRYYDNEYFKLVEVSATDEEFAFDINLCLFQEMFKKFGREDLGSIMCKYDSIIADNVSKWVRFEREETIADGCSRCTFRFYKIKQKFSDNATIDSIYSFLKIIDDSDEMLTKQKLIEKGFEAETEPENIIKLIEIIKKHPGIKTSVIEEEIAFGNVDSYKRYEEWKLLFNRKILLEERTKIIRNLPIKLKEEKVNQLITGILENPYELASIKWLCLNYLQNHFTSRIGFESEGLDEIQVSSLLEEFIEKYPKISFEVHTINTQDIAPRVSIQVYGKGVSEFRLKEPAQLLRRKIVIDFPDASVTAVKPILSVDPVAQKFFDIFEDPKQPFQLRELALRILISRVGVKLAPFLKTVSEDKHDDPFLRGRAIDALSNFTSNIPRLFNKMEEPLEEFKELPVPLQRSIVDFVARHGLKEELLIAIAKDEHITTIIRKIALRNLEVYIDPKVTDFLLDIAKERSQDEILRQTSLAALGKHDAKSRINKPVFEIFIDPEESSFIRIEALETLKELRYTPEENLHIEKTDWITTLGLKQLIEE